jgi:hypothetical protein
MEYYQGVMDEKSFSLADTAPCDDAFEDKAHEWGEIYIDSALLTDSTAIVEFKFKDACCQVFMGDYEVPIVGRPNRNRKNKQTMTIKEAILKSLDEINDLDKLYGRLQPYCKKQLLRLWTS